ncbi:MAG: hypothetical protein AB8H80_02920 [Planctomycetota bacterium]
MRILALTSLSLVSTFVLAQEQSPVSPLSSQPLFDQFEADQGGDWIVKWHPATGTPSHIYGTGIALEDWRGNSLAEARRHANQVLVDQADLLGLGSSTFREVIGARMGRTWSFTFDQSFRGVPVLEGRVDVRVNMRGVIAMIGSRAWPIQDSFNTTPAITAQLAQATAWADMGGEPNGNAAAPRLVIWGDIASPQLAPVTLAWEVPVHEIAPGDSGKFGRYLIDARTGRVLRFENDKHDCGLGNCSANTARIAPTPSASYGPSVSLTEAPTAVEDTVLPIPTTVTVMAWTRTGDDATSALQNIPFPGLELNVPGVGSRTTDNNGEFVIDINSPVTISINGLDGRHHDPISGSSAPSGSVTVQPGVNASIQLLSANASSAQAAHTTASYWTDRTNEWARSILGNTPQLNIADGIGINVNVNQTCNATYGGNNTNYYQAGNGCNNTAFSTVVAHEWGHGLDDRYGGISNSVAEGLSEGWGDIIGMYQVDSPILGSGFQNPGSGIRNGNNSRVWPYSSGVSPHGAGEVWMGWAWRFREELRSSFGTPAAISISELVVLSSIVADATNREDAVFEVFIADDDDGNLLNGTPHYNQLEAASLQKGIPYPEIPAFAAFGQGCESSIPAPPVTCPQLNGNGGNLTNATRDNEYCYQVNTTTTYEVLGFDIYSGTTTGSSVTVPAHIYLDASGEPEANPIASTTITVGAAPGFYTATFSQPVPVSGTYYLGFDTTSDNVYISTLTGGASGVGFYRDPANNQPNWIQSGLVQRPSWRVSCQSANNFVIPAMSVIGTPQLGTTYRPQVTDAPASSFAALASGVSDQVYQGLPLPLPIPGAPGCQLFVAADLFDATTTNAAGVANSPITVPNQPSLIDFEVYHQWVLWDPAANSFGFIVSDAGRARIRN